MAVHQQSSMPNGSSVHQSFFDRLGVDQNHRSQLFWASIVTLPVALWAFSARSQPQQRPETSINAFFKDKSVVPGPVAPPARRRQPTSFQSFLKKEPEAHRDPTSFSSFLKKPQSNKSTDSNASPSPAVVSGPKADDVVITVLFGTEYGFSKEVAERAAKAVTASGSYWVRLLDMADHPEGLDLSQNQAVLVVCSTQGDGVPPTEARDFCDWLGSSAAPHLPNSSYAVCALGDRSYEHFCACGKQLDRSFQALGAKRFADRVDVNREDLPAIDQWLSGVTSALKTMQLATCAQTGVGVESSESTAVKPKRWGKSRPYHGRVVAVEGLCQLASHDDKDTIRVEIDLGQSGLQYTPGDALGVYPLNCQQAVNEVLHAMGQDAHQLVSCPSWHYQDKGAKDQLQDAAADRQLTLQEALIRCYDLRSPKPELLQLLFDHMPAHALQASHNHTNGKTAGLKRPNKAAFTHGHSLGEADSDDNSTQSKANGHSHTANGKSHAVNGKAQTANGSSQLPDDTQDAHVGASSSSSQDSLTSLDSEQPVVQVDGHASGISNSTANEQAQHLQDILQDEVEAYLDKRHIIDILHDFSGCRPPLTSLLACLRPLQPRLYSISSSQLEHAERVQITVAVVKYKALGRERIGVTSTFLKERMQVGDHVPVYVAKNPDFRLPPALSTPTIMVGPGTGLAPFRAFMQERIHQQQAGSQLGKCVLFFGCRRSDQDFLYGQQLQQWADEGLLTLSTAFSRQQAQKVYVQDRLREGGDLVWKLLQEGGHFYVCGDAAHMAGSVEQALLSIIRQHQAEGQKAGDYLDTLKREERYQRDVWF